MGRIPDGPPPTLIRRILGLMFVGLVVVGFSLMVAYGTRLICQDVARVIEQGRARS